MSVIDGNGCSETDPLVVSPANLEGANVVKISVVIITCERPDYLVGSINSVLSQTLVPFEIIVVDDCSNADYQTVLSSFAQEKITYIKLPERSGANAARNKGIDISSGDIIAFLDDDDIWCEDFLQKHSDALNSGASAVICGHKVLESEHEISINSADFVTEDELRHGNRFSGMSGFSAKSEVMRKHQFDVSLKNGQDWDLFVRIACDDLVFKNIKEALFLYRKGTPDGITSKAKNMRVEHAETRLGSAVKHRAWLGEKYYKQRVADQLLSFIPKKRNKFAWLSKSIQMAGWVATFNALRKKLK